jgi:hypothetical protein
MVVVVTEEVTEAEDDFAVGTPNERPFLTSSHPTLVRKIAMEAVVGWRDEPVTSLVHVPSHMPRLLREVHESLRRELVVDQQLKDVVSLVEDDRQIVYQYSVREHLCEVRPDSEVVDVLWLDLVGRLGRDVTQDELLAPRSAFL